MSLYDLSGKRVWVTGHRGLVGSAVVRALEARGTVDIITTTRAELDLRDQAAVGRWMARVRPQAVFFGAAKVGGILANDVMPADYIVENLMIETNVIHAAHQNDTEKLLFIASGCMYPKFAEQPIREDSLLTGPLEPTNEWYAVAKIAGLKMCQAYRRQHGRDFIVAVPNNLYGPNDSFDLNNGHVLPSLLRKFHEAKESNAETVTLWGTGTPRREFMYIDDLADALVFIMEHYSEEQQINAGSGKDVEIRELASVIRDVTGFSGRIVYDTGKPDGPPRKLLDSSRLLALGWQPKVALRDGVASLYQWYLGNAADIRGRAAA